MQSQLNDQFTHQAWLINLGSVNLLTTARRLVQHGQCTGLEIQPRIKLSVHKVRQRLGVESLAQGTSLAHSRVQVHIFFSSFKEEVGEQKWKI